MKVWRYVIVSDDGGAPNFEPPATTLTVCKPRIRKGAKPGNLVIAFNGVTLNRSQPHSVRWAGVVVEVIPLDAYWSDPRFQGKKPGRARGPGESPDNIYRPNATGQLEQVRNETHTQANAMRDIGGMNALVLKPSWYFGPTEAILPTRFNLRIVGGRRGERTSDIDVSKWRDLKQWLDKHAPVASSIANPTVRGAKCRPPRRRKSC